MKIRSLKTAKEAVKMFESLFKYDTLGQKHYVYFKERDTENTLTIMKYPQGILTLNKRGEDWIESGETLISEEECGRIFWRNRKEVNSIISMRMGKRKSRGGGE